MKKLILILLILFGFSMGTQSQTVDSIKVEKAGDFVKIRYKILNSTPDQIYRVKVLCSINGGLNSEIKSITGDVGEQVTGGKSEYWVVWDVLKDVDEVKSVDFSVRAELMKENTKYNPKKINWSNKKFHILALGDYSKDAKLFGLRLGYLSKWGISAKVAVGRITDDYVLGSEGTAIVVPQLNTGVDITARIVNSNKTQLHLLAGLSYCKLQAEGSEFSSTGRVYDMYFGGDMGLILDIGRLSLTMGGSFVLPGSFYKKVPTDYYLRPGYLSFGIGFRL